MQESPLAEILWTTGRGRGVQTIIVEVSRGCVAGGAVSGLRAVDAYADFGSAVLGGVTEALASKASLGVGIKSLTPSLT